MLSNLLTKQHFLELVTPCICLPTGTLVSYRFSALMHLTKHNSVQTRLYENGCFTFTEMLHFVQKFYISLITKIVTKYIININKCIC